jgi:hypothetical protein
MSQKTAVHKQGKEKSKERLTTQHLAGGLDNAKNKGFAFFVVNNLSHQTGDLFLKGRDFLHIATCLASLFIAICA